MKTLSSSLFGLPVAAILVMATASQAAASPRTACEVLSLAEVRSLAGAQVVVFEAGSSPPTTRGDSTFSTCTYVMTDSGGRPAKGLGAKITLMWGPKTKLAETNEYYAKRHMEAPGVKGDVMVLAWIGNASNGQAGDWPASQKLLAAVLQKL